MITIDLLLLVTLIKENVILLVKIYQSRSTTGLTMETSVLQVRREFKTVDIVKRIKFIYPDNIVIENYPRKPVAIFNPGVILEGDVLKVYPRIQFDYYNYVSCIGYFELELSELESKGSEKSITCRVVIYPTLREEYLGCEDPRIQKIGNDYMMFYTGVSLVNQPPYLPMVRSFIWVKSHLCVAISKDGIHWKKLGYVKIEGKVPPHDKDGFVLYKGGRYVLFHRPIIDFKYYCWRGILDLETLDSTDNSIVFTPTEHEQRVGWSTPPVETNGDYIVLVHAKCIDQRYRIFACLIDGKTLEIEAITPYYIMEPRELPEILGDTVHVVFPCGAVRLDNYLVITYGAGDWCIGIGKIELSELLHHVDKGVIK